MTLLPTPFELGRFLRQLHELKPEAGRIRWRHNQAELTAIKAFGREPSSPWSETLSASPGSSSRAPRFPGWDNSLTNNRNVRPVIDGGLRYPPTTSAGRGGGTWCAEAGALSPDRPCSQLNVKRSQAFSIASKLTGV